ncbi:purine nucleosidase [Actinoplanes tereljensis]|uniref:Inosine-uridine nucleoside N-ribohydrolase n=1 Tax=Paractinoplanes tereljensis TaxID=571912 RepID=A0A919TT53_9ACTN|nr:nucleoside hydrolase [Actinoplanes tereljensis]GIF22143.1 inosine-uridine nucleoside N-ribohydrolase [Actinoplanes tereljensis]
MADERVPGQVLHGVRAEGGGVLKVYLDCDTGVDDALALAFLLGSPDVELLGIGTVNGNTSAVQAARNTLGLLDLAGISGIPVAVGEGAYRGGAVGVHGGNGVGGVALPAGGEPDPRTSVALLRDLVRDNPGEIHVVATGPCTNLAKVPDLDVASVTVMGGAVRTPGNVTPRAEANFRDDPQSAATVLAAPWPVTLVPLDVTMRHRWTVADQAALRAGGTPLHETLADMLPVYFESYEPRLGVREIPLHDPLAAAVAVGALTPSDAPQLPLRVDLEGAVREDPSAASSVRVVLALSEPGAPVILDRILGFRSRPLP